MKTHIVVDPAADLSGRSAEDLVAMLEHVDREVRELKAQLGKARSMSVNGRYASPTWYRDTEAAMRNKGAFAQSVLRAIGVARAREKQERHAENLARSACEERAFVDIARKVLPGPLFAEMMAAAAAKLREGV